MAPRRTESLDFQKRKEQSRQSLWASAVRGPAAGGGRPKRGCSEDRECRAGLGLCLMEGELMASCEDTNTRQKRKVTAAAASRNPALRLP